jgi:hypothetical protein
MYILKQGIKKDPQRQWALPDRIFFGYGACHILAGTFLRAPPIKGFHAERIIPAEDYAGNHIYVTDGVIAFDYHGYSSRERMLVHYAKGWSERYPGWNCDIVPVDFDLLNTLELNQRKMKGPDQYLHDAIPRGRAFIDRLDHVEGLARARATLQPG